MRMYDLSRGFSLDYILKSVRASIGKYIKFDPVNFDEMWKLFLRARITINIEKPLKRIMKIKHEGDSSSWINFKYEWLNTFYFVCGILGHTERDCNVVYANPDKIIERAYGTWLELSWAGQSTSSSIS